MPFFPASPLPYAQATAHQRAQLVHSLQGRLRRHFPALPARAFARALDEFRPALWFSGTQATLASDDLFQLVQYLGHSPELPLLDPPLFGRPTLALAQHIVRTGEFGVGALVELARAPGTRCGPRLWGLLQRTTGACPLAEQVVQAQRWDLPGCPQLPPSLPGGGPAPGSPAVERLLHTLVPAAPFGRWPVAASPVAETAAPPPPPGDLETGRGQDVGVP